MRIYKEKTADKGYPMRCCASDNFATYILTSARAHDMRAEYVRKYDRSPSASWYNRNFQFERIK